METTKTTETLTDLSRKGTCIEFFSAYQDMDIERMIALAAPDATVYFQPLGEEGKGLFREFGKTVWILLMDCFPDLNNTVDTLAVEGDAITCNVVIYGTQAKEFLGIPSQGLRFESDHIFIFQFDDKDQITELTIHWDHARFVSQLTGN
jgi:predicted ester cyclase